MGIKFSTKLANRSKKYTKEYILERIDDFSLYQRYIPELKLRKAFCSPLRNDSNPSFSIFPTKDGSILYKDHANGESGDVFKFLKQLWNCSIYEVYQKIVDDLPSTVELAKQKQRVCAQDITISIRRQKFSQSDLDYWNRYNISIDTLTRYKVTAIKYFVIDGIVQAEHKQDDPMFAYKVNDKFKIYRPLTKYKKNKWRGSLSKRNVFGLEQLPKQGNMLIITKSLKDVMVLYDLGYDAVAPASESTEIPSDIMLDLLNRFKTVIFFFDNDEAGIQFSTKMANKYSTPRMEIDAKHQVKDISDFIEKYDTDSTKAFLSSFLSGYE